MISNELMGFAGLALTALLAQRVQNNALAKRLEDGVLKRLDDLEKDSAELQLDMREVKTVCKLRQAPREGSVYQGI